MCSSGPAGTGGGPGDGAGLGLRAVNAHSPEADPETRFGAAPPSPNCTAGSLLRQVMFPLTRLLTISMPSGSLVTLLVKVTLPPTLSRSDPSQQVCRPATVRLPPMTLSSTSVY